MLERLEILPAGIESLKAVRKVTREDYERVLEPMLDDARCNARENAIVWTRGSVE